MGKLTGISCSQERGPMALGPPEGLETFTLTEPDDEYLNYLGRLEALDDCDIPGQRAAAAFVPGPGGEPVQIGAIAWLPAGAVDGSPSGWIRHAYVRPEFEGRGVLRALLAEYAADPASPGLDGDFMDSMLKAACQRIVSQLRAAG